MIHFLEHEFEEFEIAGYTNWMVACMGSLAEDMLIQLFDATSDDICYILETDPDDIAILVWERLTPFAVSRLTGECLVRDNSALRWCSLPRMQGFNA
tara:strand:- start:3880 stop:4170 length:291 start_codon:yes stop_codon:yes gene_type:complete